MSGGGAGRQGCGRGIKRGPFGRPGPSSFQLGAPGLAFAIVAMLDGCFPDTAELLSETEACIAQH